MATASSLEACLETKRGSLGLLFEITLFNLTIEGVKYQVIPFLAKVFRIIGSYARSLYTTLRKRQIARCRVLNLVEETRGAIERQI